jgi:hypothetical protein
MNRMQLKTQSWCQGGILRGRPCVPHHTRTGPEWWRSPAELRCDVMLTGAGLFLICWYRVLIRSALLGVYLLTHMLFGHYSVLIVGGITRVTLERIPYNE